MPEVYKVRRRKRPHRKLDTSALREHVRDGRLWAALGLVVKDGTDPHYTIDGSSDVYVEVMLVPTEVRISARLMSLVGGPGEGIWRVPPVGSEVLVVIPDGELLAGPVVVGTLSTGAIPTGTQGINDSTPSTQTIIIGSSVLIHSGAGGAAPLPTLEEFKNHIHPTGTGPSGKPTDPIAGVGAIVGTTVLKAK